MTIQLEHIIFGCDILYLRQVHTWKKVTFLKGCASASRLTLLAPVSPCTMSNGLLLKEKRDLIHIIQVKRENIIIMIN